MTVILDKFAKAYKAQTDGQGRTEMVTDRLTGGARIDYICSGTLKRNLELLKPLDGVSDLEIIIAIRNAVGIGMRLFQPEVSRHYFKAKSHYCFTKRIICSGGASPFDQKRGGQNEASRSAHCSPCSSRND